MRRIAQYVQRRIEHHKMRLDQRQVQESQRMWCGGYEPAPQRAPVCLCGRRYAAFSDVSDQKRRRTHDAVAITGGACPDAQLTNDMIAEQTRFDDVRNRPAIRASGSGQNTEYRINCNRCDNTQPTTEMCGTKPGFPMWWAYLRRSAGFPLRFRNFLL